jgi:hypothetical protein
MIHFALIGICMACGCAGTPTGDEPASQEPPPLLEDAKPPSSMLSAPKLLLAATPGNWDYRLVEGTGAGNSVSIRFEPVSDLAHPWRRHTSDQRIEHLGFDAQGNLLMGAVEDLKHQALTKYDPPLLVIPAAMKAGQSITVESNMTVLDRSDPRRKRDSGKCVKTIHYDADQAVNGPRGRTVCRRLSTVFRADLGLASVEATSQEWYAESIGLVAEKSEEKISALIFKMGGKRAIVLIDRPE